MGEKEQKNQTENTEEKSAAVSENWAEETIQELLDFWEEQGIYIRE